MSLIHYDYIGWFDGGCEPRNPGGLGTWGFILEHADERPVVQDKGDIGRGPHVSNNVAEYVAIHKLLLAIGKFCDSSTRILVQGDSNMVIQQMSGNWQVKRGLYVPYYIHARDYLEELQANYQIELKWIPREQNTRADELAGQVLSSHKITPRLRRG